MSLIDEIAPTELAKLRLLAELDRIQALLADRAADRPPSVGRVDTVPVLDWLADRLGLSPFERDTLMLCVAVELESSIAASVAELQGFSGAPQFATALAVLPDPHWDALSAERPLRRWNLVRLALGATRATSPMVIDERILDLVTGSGPGRLGGLVTDGEPPAQLTPSQARVADEIVAAVTASDGRMVIRLGGADQEARRGVIARIASELGWEPLVIRDAAVDERDLAAVATLLDREAILDERMLVTSHDSLLPLLETAVVVTSSSAPTPGRIEVARTIDLPTPAEQAALWRAAVPDAIGALSIAVDSIAQHYRLSANAVAAIAAEWRRLRNVAVADHAASLRRLARERARVGMGSLAERIEPRAGWDDLVLPPGQLEQVREIARHVRHRALVYNDWGFAARSDRGLGISALFTGESGTGKTMAAEVIAADLALDLYRVDLSAVVSKYIGETEKNLRAVFDAAETSGAVLLFDEADALFGTRSEIKDSHDRYANLEVAYLLQRMESYRGLAILTTNIRSNVDRAFLRRFRFVVPFPFPDQSSRTEIWRRAFPPSTPLDGVDPGALSTLQVSGGSIRSIALAAAFSAAEDGTAVRPEHLIRAAQLDYAKAERSLTASETAALRASAQRKASG